LIQQAEAVADEVMRERATHLAVGPDPLPMCRALRRLRNDLAMIGRATAEPLPESIRKPLSEPTAATGSAIADSSKPAAQQSHDSSRHRRLNDAKRNWPHFATTLTGLRRGGLLHRASG